MPNVTAGYRLEQYTLKRPQEVLMVKAEVEGEVDTVVIFKGFSSSLVRPTSADPDVPVLPEDATILSIDRLIGPYTPNQPRYIATGISWAEFQLLLLEIGV